MSKFIKNTAIATVMLCVAGASSVAHGQNLMIDVIGVPGTGLTTWTFGGTPDTVTTAGSIRVTSANTFSAWDSGQFPFGQNTILDTSIQDVVFLLTGTAAITIGGETQPIAGIYLDDDGASADDLGVRAAVQLDYAVGEISSWTGSGTALVDINAFVAGTWSINSTQGQAMFFADPITVTFTPVPEPATFFVLGIGALVAMRRRSKK